MKIPSAELRACWLKRRVPTTEKQVEQWEKENPPETQKKLPPGLRSSKPILMIIEARREAELYREKFAKLSAAMLDGCAGYSFAEILKNHRLPWENK